MYQTLKTVNLGGRRCLAKRKSSHSEYISFRQASKMSGRFQLTHCLEDVFPVRNEPLVRMVVRLCNWIRTYHITKS